MKKTLAVILTLCLCIGLCACLANNKNSSANFPSYTPGNTSDNTSENPEDPAPTEDTNSNDDESEHIDVSKIYRVADFSNSLAFLQFKDDANTYCIDKTGKQLFALENCYIYGFAKFNGKIAMVSTYNTSEYLLCDKQGKIYTAEDFNASRFFLKNDNYKEAFLDGYIFLERKEESHTGTKIEMSIMDSNFTTLVPFSVDLANILSNNGVNCYCDGYFSFQFNDTILDLRTGALLTDRTQINVSNPTLFYRSDGTSGGKFEHLEGGDIYNELTGEVVAKVEDHESISFITFVGDLGLAQYRADNGWWFNVISKDGIAQFDPIKAAYANIAFDGETILVYNVDYVEKDGQSVYGCTIKTYDTLGNLLGEIFLEDWSTVTVQFNDGVVIIQNVHSAEYLFLTPTLENLF